MSAEIQGERTAADRLATLSRDDVLAVAAAYKRVGRRTELLGTAAVIGGFAVGAILLQLRGSFGWPSWLDVPFLLGGFALALISAVSARQRQRKELASFQLFCPVCNTAMLTSHPWRTEVSRAELIASTGVCPSCGERILEKER
jgi:hypothetical protein